MVRIRIKPIESRASIGSTRWLGAKKVYRVVSAESGEMGARFAGKGGAQESLKSPRTLYSQAVGQHKVPLPPPAGCYAAQHGLLDGADGALRKVGVAPGHLLLDVPEIHQLLVPLKLGAVVGVHVGRHPRGPPRWCARKTVLQPRPLSWLSMATSMKG